MKKPKKIGRWMAYARRAQGYVSMLNLLMLIILTIDAKTKWEIPLYIYILSFPTIFVFMVIVGYVDTKSGVREAESLDNELNRPILMEIHKIITKNDTKMDR